MLDVKSKKQEVRFKYKNLRNEIQVKKKFEMDVQIHIRLLSLHEYVNCSTLFTYVSKKSEVDTVNIIKSSLEVGKKVAVPKCDVENNVMDFYFIRSFEDLALSSLDILEPVTTKCELVKNYPRDSVCLVPGLVFDVSGARVGYGKGYYDRFLENYKGCTVGLCYSNCLVETVPQSKLDKSVMILVTDKNIRKAKNKGGFLWQKEI